LPDVVLGRDRPRRGPFLDELEAYVETYSPRERSDVVYVNVR
jgi:hypothetical protein